MSFDERATADATVISEASRSVNEVRVDEYVLRFSWYGPDARFMPQGIYEFEPKQGSGGIQLAKFADEHSLDAIRNHLPWDNDGQWSTVAIAYQPGFYARSGTWSPDLPTFTVTLRPLSDGRNRLTFERLSDGSTPVEHLRLSAELKGGPFSIDAEFDCWYAIPCEVTGELHVELPRWSARAKNPPRETIHREYLLFLRMERIPPAP